MNLSRRFFTKLGLRTVFYGGAIGSIAHAFFIEPNRLSTTRREVFIDDLDPALDGFTIAHLTDFHHRSGQDKKLLTKVTKALQEEPADLIALTGDFVDHDIQHFPALLAHIKQWQAKHGTICSLGNHDGWSAPREYFVREFDAIGVRTLINQNIKLEHAGSKPLYIAGTDYVWRGRPDPHSTLANIPADANVLALVHEPDYFDILRQQRKIDLQLSGHTHGGQCRVPLIGYAPAKVDFGRNYVYDLHERDGSQVFVSRGVGTTGVRVRFACAPELARITLRRKT